MHTPEALDATLGMQELEDAVAENQWRTSNSYGQGSFLPLKVIAQRSVW